MLFFCRELEDFDIKFCDENSFTVENVTLRLVKEADKPNEATLQIAWSFEDEELGTYLHALAKENFKF